MLFGFSTHPPARPPIQKEKSHHWLDPSAFLESVDITFNVARRSIDQLLFHGTEMEPYLWDSLLHRVRTPSVPGVAPTHRAC